MPSASSKTSQPTPQTNVSSDLLQEPLKNAVSVMEKKLRNLEKRKIKILDTKKKADKGGELNEDQKKALESFIVVESSLELVKELHKNMSALDSEYGKLLKKDQKRMKQAEAHQVEVNSKNKVAGVVEVQAILGAMTEEVRADFLSGSHSACQLTEDDLANLDSFYELVNVQVEEGTHKKLSEHINDVTEHLNKVVDGKAKPALENEITYKDIAEIVSKIRASKYFDKESTNGESEAAEEEEEVAVEETPEEVESQPEQPKDEEVQLDEAPVQEEAVTPEPQAPEPEESAVDLPPEVKEISPEAEPLNFLGDSEISTPVEENQQAQLNPVSPEFVPRNSFAATTPEDNGTNDGWEQPPPAESDWKSVDNQSYNYRGRGGRGGRGFGRGRGRGGSGGGNYRGGNREGGYRGNNRGRGNGEYRGGRGGNRGSGEYRGGRGEYRGRGGNRGGRDNRQYQQQQAQQ